MTYGPIQVFQVGIASGASTSSTIDLGGKSFNRLAVNAVTMSTGAMLTVYGSDTSTGTFNPVYQKVVNTAASAYLSLTVGTAASGGWCQIDAPPMRYIQLITSAVVSGGVSITVIGSD
jgi:hypothetical protein